MSHPVVEARRRRQDELVQRVRDWAQGIGLRLEGLVAVVVYGSVARGDFNLWSDIDVLVVAEDLPEGFLARAELLSPVPPGVQAVVWLPSELAEARQRRNPIAREADEVGIVVFGRLPAPAP